jgi:hypothetical protein
VAEAYHVEPPKVTIRSFQDGSTEDSVHDPHDRIMVVGSLWR